MKKIILLILIGIILLFSFFCYTKLNNKIQNEKNEIKVESPCKNCLRLECFKLTSEKVKELKMIIKENNFDGIIIENILKCKDVFNQYDFKNFEESIFSLKLSYLVFDVEGKYLDNIEEIFKRSKIKNISIGICRKEGDKFYNLDNPNTNCLGGPK